MTKHPSHHTSLCIQPRKAQRRHPAAAGSAQRGVAALAITLLLFFTMTLAAAYANRGLWVEQRAAANQYRAAQAFEAAEAGLEWATAQLNDPQRIDSRCQHRSADSASDTATDADASFRRRFLHADPHSGQHTPVTWLSAGTAIALQAACTGRADGAGWSCSCPTTGLPSLDTAGTGFAAGAAAADRTTPLPAFLVQFARVAQPGVVRITSIGCTSADGPCRPGAASRADASATVHSLLGLLPGLSIAPSAALTVKGTVDAGPAAFGIHNTDAASGGTTVHAGGDLRGAAIRLRTAPGGVDDASAATHDRALAAMASDRLFSTYFGLDKATWKSHAAVQSLRCGGACTAAVASAIARSDSNHLLWLDGDAQFDGPATLGTPEHPVVIVVNGEATLRGEVQLHGVLYAADVHWQNTTGAADTPAQTHGALISESGFQAHGTAQVHYDAAVLRALQTHTGSFVRVPGSWRDF